MKAKIISVLLILILILGVIVGLTACNNKEETSDSSATISSYEADLKKSDSKALAKLTNAKEFTKFMQELAGSPETYTSSDIEEKYESLLEDTDDFENYKIVKTYPIQKEKDLDKLEIDNGNMEAMIEDILDLDFINNYSIYVLKVKMDDKDSYDYVVLNKNGEIVFSELLSIATMHISGGFAISEPSEPLELSELNSSIPEVSGPTESNTNASEPVPSESNTSSSVPSPSEATAQTNLDQMEIQMFNSQFTVYQGRQIGAGVKPLIDLLISNYAANQGSEERIPEVSFSDVTKSIYQTIISSSENYASEVSQLKQSIAERHYYTVGLEYSDSGIINRIIINY